MFPAAQVFDLPFAILSWTAAASARQDACFSLVETRDEGWSAGKALIPCRASRDWALWPSAATKALGNSAICGKKYARMQVSTTAIGTGPDSISAEHRTEFVRHTKRSCCSSGVFGKHMSMINRTLEWKGVARRRRLSSEAVIAHCRVPLCVSPGSGSPGSAVTNTSQTSDGVPNAPQKPRGTWPALGFHCIDEHAPSKWRHFAWDGASVGSAT